MKTLGRQIERYRQIQWTLGAVMACMALSFYIFGYAPAMSRMETLKLQIQSKQRDVDQTQNKARTLPFLMREVRDLELRVESYDRQFPKQPQIGEFIRDMTATGQQLSLKNWNYKPSAPRRSEGFFELPIVMSFQGDFMNACSFVRRVEQLQRRTRVKRLVMKSRDARSGLVDVEMALSIYFSEG